MLNSPDPSNPKSNLNSPQLRQIYIDLSIEDFAWLPVDPPSVLGGSTENLSSLEIKVAELEPGQRQYLFNALISDLLDSEHLSEMSKYGPVGFRYYHQLIPLFDNIVVSPNLTEKAEKLFLNRVNERNHKEFKINDLFVLHYFVGPEFYKKEEVIQALHQRIDMELQERFATAPFLLASPGFNTRVEAYTKDISKCGYILECVKCFLETTVDQKFESTLEEVLKEGEGDIEEKAASASIFYKSGLPPALIAATIIDIFQIQDLTADPEFLSIVGVCIDRDLGLGLLKNLNNWLTLLERNPSNLFRIAPGAQKVIDDASPAVYKALIEHLLCQDSSDISELDFKRRSVSLVNETARNFLTKEQRSRKEFINAIIKAADSLITNDDKVHSSQVLTLLKLIPSKSIRSRIINDTAIGAKLKAIYESEVLSLNDDISALDGSHILNEDSTKIDQVVCLYRLWRSANATKALLGAAMGAREFPTNLMAIGDSQLLITDVVEGVIYQSATVRPEFESMHLGSWKNMLSCCEQMSESENPAERKQAELFAKQLIKASLRLPDVEQHGKDIANVLKLHALSASDKENQMKRFRRGLVFGIRVYGLEDNAVATHLSKMSEMLALSSENVRDLAIGRLASIIRRAREESASNNVAPDEAKRIKMLFGRPNVADEIGIPHNWFQKILLEAGSNWF